MGVMQRVARLCLRQLRLVLPLRLHRRIVSVLSVLSVPKGAFI